MGFGRRHLVLIIIIIMLMVICHIDTPGEREREREREEKKRAKKRRKREDKRERIGCAIDIYTYICMLLNSVYKTCSILKGHIHTREVLLLPILKYATSAAIYAMGK